MPKKPGKAPDGKFMATVKVGERGQIVIPKAARDMFDIQAGDTLLLLADIDRGIAIMQYDPYEIFASHILAAKEETEKEDDT